MAPAQAISSLSGVFVANYDDVGFNVVLLNGKYITYHELL